MIFFSQHFYKKLLPEMQKEMNLSSAMAVPRLEKVVISMSVKQVLQEKRALEDAVHELSLITGQKPMITKVKKSIANFKIRKGMSIGCKVTLRSSIMYDFVYRLINVVFPRIRDFRGLSSKAFDLQGNYNIGIKEEVIFPEIDYDKIRFNKGMNITFVINSKNTQDSLFLLKKLGVPIKK